MSNAFLFAKMYKDLMVFDRQLQKRGFQGVFPEYIRAYPYDLEKWRVHSASGTLLDQVKITLETIDKVCVSFPKEAQCIHRSFLGFRYLRSWYGIHVHLVIGVRKFPFYAHAWLVVEDHPINDTEEYTGQFSIILHSKEEAALA